jgi:hypothetical protein
MRADVERQIRQEIELAREAHRDDMWITYLIRDPRRPDLKGNPEGWPVYVGQTDDFGKRVCQHLRKSEKLARKGKGVKYRLKELLHAGSVPNFEVLDRQPTRLRSLLSETNYARLCRSRGYDIANQTRLQNVAGPPVSIQDLPTKWVQCFTLAQAVEDAIEIETLCRECGGRVHLAASVFAHLPNPPKVLRDILTDQDLLKSPCSSCGEEGVRRVVLRLPTAN